jgi:hypothetical protein
MRDRDRYEPGVPAVAARTQTRGRLPCRHRGPTAAPPDLGGAASTLSQLVIASQVA